MHNAMCNSDSARCTELIMDYLFITVLTFNQKTSVKNNKK